MQSNDHLGFYPKDLRGRTILGSELLGSLCRHPRHLGCIHLKRSSWYDEKTWWLSGKESTCQCRKCRFDPWAGKMPRRRAWQPNPMVKSLGQRAWWATTHEVTKSWTQLGDCTHDLNHKICSEVHHYPPSCSNQSNHFLFLSHLTSSHQFFFHYIWDISL